MPLQSLPTPPHLLQRAAQGHADALGSLLRTRKDRVYQLVTTLMLARSTAPAASRLRAQLDADANDECSRQPPSGEYPVGQVLEGLPPSLSWLANWRLLDELHLAFCALPYSERQALILADVEGLAGDQVAWLLNLTEAEVLVRRARGRELLQKQLLSSPQTCQSA
jgi:DNA-directed RNA polymerase specialized sigma24 family protein